MRNDDSTASLQQKTNLARIRVNQRRSRARRKEHLQNLQQRLRACELQGIAVSTEVQVAARKVAEENMQLRGLLHSHGFSDEVIDEHLQRWPVPTICLDAQQPFLTQESMSAVGSLQQLSLPQRGEQGPSPRLLSQSRQEMTSAEPLAARSSLHGPNPVAVASYGSQQPPLVLPPGILGPRVEHPSALPDLRPDRFDHVQLQPIPENPPLTVAAWPVYQRSIQELAICTPYSLSIMPKWHLSSAGAASNAEHQHASALEVSHGTDA